jgi:hypothetical protein
MRRPNPKRQGVVRGPPVVQQVLGLGHKYSSVDPAITLRPMYPARGLASCPSRGPSRRSATPGAESAQELRAGSGLRRVA